MGNVRASVRGRLLLSLLLPVSLLIVLHQGAMPAWAGAAGGTLRSAPTTQPATPIRVGGTLALSGVFAATGKIHQIAGQEFVRLLNERGGLLGRPVEWVLLDDESVPDKAAALYERLITEHRVDLIIGPYGTANITAAMRVAERYGYVFPHHTGSLTYAYTYRWHFPTWQTGLNTHITTPGIVFDAYLSHPNPPRTVGLVVNKFPGTQFLAYGKDNQGGAIRVAQQKGLRVVLDVSYETAITDWAPIAQRIRQANPDLLYVAGLGLDGPNLLAALAQVGWRPRHHFYQWPSPGPLLASGVLADRATTVTMFEPYEPFLSNPGARDFVQRFTAAARAAGLAYPVPEIQAAASWGAWQVLAAGVEGCRCLEHPRIAEYLLTHEIPTVLGYLTFNPQEQNYGPDRQVIKQIQDGQWYVVWPREFASEGRSLR